MSVLSPYLLVLSDGLLLLLDASELQVVRPVAPRHGVALGAVRAADLTARTGGLVDEGAGGAGPTLGPHTHTHTHAHTK